VTPATRDGAPWSREEHLLAFNLYWRLPFGRLDKGTREIIELAEVLRRTPSSVAMKLNNFASLDPALQQRGIRGLTSIAKGVAEVWREFQEQPEQLAFESEAILAKQNGRTIEESADIDDRDLPPVGIERDALIRVRVNQSFFRRRIISAYNRRCCVTGLSVPELLVASHIVPWSQDPANRLNPRNGLCLNALHDKAFDRGLMWIEDGYVVRISEKLRVDKFEKDSAMSWLRGFEGATLRLPQKFTPDPELLRRHREGWDC
jgi:putative restriction endonuclease